MKIIIHTDGGARGNPGPAAVGVVIEECQCVRVSECQEKRRKKIIDISKTIGETTNNVAEYCAVLEGLRTINDQQPTVNKIGENLKILFFLDSMLVVNQLNGLFKIKDTKLRQLFLKIKILEQGIKGTIVYEHIPRKKNFEADALVNKALDS